MARRPKFTATAQQAILRSLRAGATRTAAAAAAGMAYETFRRHAAVSVEFRAAIEKAEAQAETDSVRVVRAAMRDHWQAAAWWLERRRAEDYGRVDRVELTLRQTAERLAAQIGVGADELIAEAERIVRRG